jgi:predicted ATP-grasp superfamily ATP-dependent carboligase
VARPDPVVIVFGAHITALAVIRAFGRTGVPVYAAGRDRTTIARSRWYRPVPGEQIYETAGREPLANYLQALPFGRSVLFPCSDRWALALASLPDSVARFHVPVVAPADVVRVLVDKQLFARAAAAHGGPAPRVLAPDQLGDIDPDEVPHFFIKPRNSQLFSDRFGVKALQLGGPAHASEALSRLAADGIEVLLQELIPGPPTAHVFLDGYVDRTGTMRACLARRRLRMYPRPFGNSTLSVTIPCEEVAEAVESLRRLLSGMGYVGLFDAEFKLDARDGRFKILEVNARPWWQLELAGASGLDVCTMAYRDALGEAVATRSTYHIGKTWVHPVPDLSAWWTGLKQGDRTGGFPVRSWFTGPNTVFSWDDPKPALEEIGRFFKVAVFRRKTRPALTREANARLTGRTPAEGRGMR